MSSGAVNHFRTSEESAKDPLIIIAFVFPTYLDAGFKWRLRCAHSCLSVFKR